MMPKILFEQNHKKNKRTTQVLLRWKKQLTKELQTEGKLSLEGS